ncbi:RNA polymerase sigma factor [Flammeovirga sp. EKP202]|uniref:RNA polymerase sigma factor n=1 Tax=Flammeovirga sp. EKP202 TaxID=2770592 RepID=UPI00165FECFD|nr:RNA polymerase sigma-70 factor [Flammeovirga sp. EKP202]MBD0404933.1 RNA polymerase sigma-70 factor [Flammeovirga sp. EKP202]
MNELQLFREISEGDINALNILFETYYQRLCDFAFTYLNDYPQAEELVSDVFVKIWESKSILKGVTYPRSFLFTMVKNQCISLTRKTKLTVSSIDEIEVVQSTLSPEENILTEDLNEAWEQFKVNIPSLQLQAFELSRFHQLKYQEIAEVLEISVKTVEKYIGNTLKMIHKDFLEKHL